MQLVTFSSTNFAAYHFFLSILIFFSNTERVLCDGDLLLPNYQATLPLSLDTLKTIRIVNKINNFLAVLFLVVLLLFIVRVFFDYQNYYGNYPAVSL